MSRSIRFFCQACKKKLKARPGQVGQRVKCPGCSTILSVPATWSGDQPVPAPPPAPIPQHPIPSSPTPPGPPQTSSSSAPDADATLREIASREDNPIVQFAELLNRGCDPNEVVEAIKRRNRRRRRGELGEARKALLGCLVNWVLALGMAICLGGMVLCFIAAVLMRLGGVGNIGVIVLGLVFLGVGKLLAWGYEEVTNTAS